MQTKQYRESGEIFMQRFSDFNILKWFVTRS